ncbi:MAG: hypothetical protein PUJ11_06035 [Eubacteriaceae bacterium]|nr:hypothetical protein [Eubacteriaceae bacterium]
MYRIKTSERNNDKATEYETKSLLYLLTKIKGHRSIDLFIIDCLNDVTGVAEGYKDSWDIQSKNVTSLTPRQVGIALYTLFANYVSDLSFGHYILFLPSLKDGYVKDIAAEVFQIDNFVAGKIKAVKSGLESEIERRNDIDVNTASNLTKIDSFLSDVIFITDRYNKSDYIKSIIKFKNLSSLKDEFLIRIFEEIRAKQAVKKIPNVNGVEVNSIQETAALGKNITRKEIELLVVNRVIGNDLFSRNGIPLYFIREVSAMDEEDIADLIQECQSQIGKTLFNKNNKKAFWHLLEEIISVIEADKNLGIRSILSQISDKPKGKVFTMDENALLYLIALVKEGLEHEDH